MDVCDVMANSINMMGLENGDQRQLLSSACEDSMLHDFGDMASDHISRNVNHLEEKETGVFFAVQANGETATITIAGSEVEAVSKGSGEKNPNQEDNSISTKVQVTAKRASSLNGKSTTSKAAAAASLRKQLDGNDKVTTSISNGLTSQSKQPLSSATNCRLSNDSQAVEDYARADVGKSQMSGKIRAATSINDVSLPEVSRDQKKNPKSLKSNASDNSEEHPESTLDSKPRRPSTTPSYSFSFKCNERAEKRKEFYSKLEEKVHAREMEKSNFQAKTKETQEAEMKLLRKSLTFKATPMPSFYQEPAPPKVELKKLPPTRAKSPKFGRQKSSSQQEKVTNTGRNQSRVSQSVDLSLHHRTSQNGVAKDPIVRVKKHQRKSLPRLPSQKSTSPNPVETCTPDQEPRNEKSDLEGTQPTLNAVLVTEATERNAEEKSDLEGTQPILNEVLVSEPTETDAEEGPIEQESGDQHHESTDKEETSTEEECPIVPIEL